MDVWYNTAENWWNLPNNNPKSDLYNINAHTKFGNFDIYTGYHPEMKIQMARCMKDRRMDWSTDSETIIPHYYHVVGVTKWHMQTVQRWL